MRLATLSSTSLPRTTMRSCSKRLNTSDWGLFQPESLDENGDISMAEQATGRRLWCRRRESNPHWAGPKPAASAIGLRRRAFHPRRRPPRGPAERACPSSGSLVPAEALADPARGFELAEVDGD